MCSFDESMVMFELIKELERKEITIYNDGGFKRASLYKWHRKYNEIPLDLNCIIELIHSGILEEDSGNFETGEVHYVVSHDKLMENIFRISNMDGLLPAIRELRLNKLLN